MQRHLPERVDSARDLVACRDALRAGSKSFAAASRLLPARVRDAATILYSFCREADDAVDLHAGGVDAVAELRARLDGIYAGTPRAFSTDRAMADVVRVHALPRELLDALIEGFEWDAGGRRYATMDELQDYAARVAGTIGAMMSVLMGTRSASAVARACDLGVAMQLTNIARDVGEDARAGRLYLPLDALHAAGIDSERWLVKPEINDGVRAVIRNVLGVAEALYAKVDSGVAQLAPECRPGINAARFIYAEIGRVVANSNYDSVSRRAIVSRRRKVWLLGRAWVAGTRLRAGGDDGPLAATRYLVDAVTMATFPDAERTAASSLPWWHVRSRALWLLDLFEQMERRERAASLHGLMEAGLRR
ncbi:MAG: phytoene/squalene synthase family protein [Dokdonella sp.]|uniref:phytoene/squalene synthase family protein n=1 Tax=Dokdonella sp. TaxID=2291710 RepID=UPI0032669BAF